MRNFFPIIYPEHGLQYVLLETPPEALKHSVFIFPAAANPSTLVSLLQQGHNLCWLYTHIHKMHDTESTQSTDLNFLP